MIHIPLQAETIARFGPLTITNTMMNAWIAILVFAIVGLTIKLTVKEKPGRVQNFVEALLEFMLKFFDQVTGSREKSKRFLPIAGTLFFFILLSNWMGLLPGMGSIGLRHGDEFIPLFRSAMSDLNLTLAMALVAVVSAHLVGIWANGFFKHANKFIQLGGIWKALKTLSPIKILTALIEFVVGIIEIFSEFAKIASLSLRLFGNVFAGEVLMTVIASLIAFVIPLPFMGLELIVGIVQATVFAMLTLVYLSVLSMPPHGEHVEASHP